MNILGYIPARGGSKGLPRKHLLPLGGKPLIAWTIQAAKESKLLTHIFVDTDDEEIANVSRQYGAWVPFLRPKDLAKDESPVPVEYTLERLKREEDICFDILTGLFPTFPFRRKGLIDTVITTLINEPVGFVSCIARVQDNIDQWLCERDAKWMPFLDYNVSAIFWHSSAILGVATCSVNANFTYPRPQIGAGASRWKGILLTPVESIDIDEEQDFIMAETIVENSLFDFPQ